MSQYAIILAGGKGERFWPLSTTRQPKQLLALVGDRPLLAQAVDRLDGLIPPERTYVITNQDLVDGCRAAAPRLPAANIIGEPIGRDTAAAVALAAAIVKRQDPGGCFCILTADHVIGDLRIFQKTLERGFELAGREDVLITIGIKPTFPSTGFGYIDSGTARDDLFLKVNRFVEKPDAATAKEYVESGSFYWNSGMFIWSVAALEQAFQSHRPVLAGLIGRLVSARDLPRAITEEYPKLEKISIDYALMEKAPNIVMAKGLFSWDDVGSWTALEHHFPHDAAGNVVIGAGQQVGARNNIIFSRDRLTAVVGLDDVIVVQAEGVTLVCAKDRAQDIKKLVEQLRADGGFGDVL